MQVEVYYEVLCSDTRNFIRRQLHPVWQQLGHKNIMEIQWKPYGKARVRKNVFKNLVFAQ